MTRDELDKLTPEQKRIRIAELCGWRLLRTDYSSTWANPADSRRGGLLLGKSTPPDYLNDLNAMHEAEKVMDKRQRIKWARIVYDAENQSEFGAIHATAEQRADALLLTIA